MAKRKALRRQWTDDQKREIVADVGRLVVGPERNAILAAHGLNMQTVYKFRRQLSDRDAAKITANVARTAKARAALAAKATRAARADANGAAAPGSPLNAGFQVVTVREGLAAAAGAEPPAGASLDDAIEAMQIKHDLLGDFIAQLKQYRTGGR